MFTNEKGFTLIEMLVVLLIISVLLIITIPNIAQNNQMVRDKGCAALVKLAEAQVQAYYINEEEMPTLISDLETKGYITETTCPNGSTLSLSSDGKVTSAP
ncbi:competence type IV pilus major pilin ComGC [Thalassobacillus devorans]|uniref:competence type IV pilus major pilin ComGC n=1 Tax=Thalassobacillus devorans TaxID=279813 RepID=UPI0004B6B120|nr:competence type IV pilus major pilin ComGC [Thalassobacillus devorans]